MIKLSIGLIGKRLRVVCTDGSVFEGLCFGYDQSFNNEPPMDSISVETDSRCYELFIDEIASVEKLD